MVAKLIVWDEHRDAALARMRQALADYRVVGVASNIPFLSRLVACPAFAGADLDTGLIERQRDYLFPGDAPLPAAALLVATVAELLREQAQAEQAARHSTDPWSPWAARDGWRMNLTGRRTLTWKATSSDSETTVEVAYSQDGWTLSLHGAAPVLARGQCLGGDRLAVELDDRRLLVSVVAVDDPQGERRHVFLDGSTYLLERHDPLHKVAAVGHQGGGLTAPMPGKVVALLAAPGQQVAAGAPLLILEAMKMEHTITAPQAGVVTAFRYAVGEQVGDGAELVDFAAG
jgi:3-methylcrotonyl-CoA carboxylase alpha subunit